MISQLVPVRFLVTLGYNKRNVKRAKLFTDLNYLPAGGYLFRLLSKFIQTKYEDFHFVAMKMVK